MRPTVFALLLAALCRSSLAATPDYSFEPNAEMAKLATLAGRWTGVSTRNMNVNTVIRVIAGGSTIIEQIKPEHVPEMISVYCPLGAHTLCTHYCASHTQPRMATHDLPKDGSKLEFRFLDSTGNLSSNQLPMHDFTIDFLDKDHFRQTWYPAGSKKEFQVLEYTRAGGPPPDLAEPAPFAKAR